MQFLKLETSFNTQMSDLAGRIDFIVKEMKDYKQGIEEQINSRFTDLELNLNKNIEMCEYLDNHINGKTVYYDEKING